MGVALIIRFLRCTFYYFVVLAKNVSRDIVMALIFGKSKNQGHNKVLWLSSSLYLLGLNSLICIKSIIIKYIYSINLGND